MITRNALLAEQEQFFSEIQYNKGRYIDFLDTMARFHKYPLRQQISLYFHAAADGTAYASRDIWERLGTTVKADAVGVPILEGEKGREDVRYIFEARDTLDYNREDIQARFWQYDEDMHGAHIARTYPDGATTEDRIAAECKRLAHGSAEMEDLAASTAAYIVLARMRLPAKETYGLKILMSAWPEPPYSLEGVLEVANDISNQILSPLGQWIRTEGRERNDDAGLLHDFVGDGRSLGERGMGEGTLPGGNNGNGPVDGGTGRDGRGERGGDGDSRTRGVGAAPDAVHPRREADAVEGTAPGRGSGDVPEEIPAGDGGTGNKVSDANGGNGERLGDSGLHGAGAETKPDRGDREGIYPGGNLPVITDEDRAALQVDGVEIISSDRAKEIIAQYEEKLETGDESDRGRFLVLPETERDGFTAIDNRNGDCLKEEFLSLDAAAYWLVGNADMEDVLDAFPEECPVEGASTDGDKDVRQIAETGEVSGNTMEADNDERQTDIQDTTEAASVLSITDVMANLDFSADMSSTTGKRKVFQRNLAAIRLVKQLEADGRVASDEERALLRSYAGWGGIPEAFDPFNAAWKDEYNILRSTLSDEEFTAARASALNAHYTPSAIVESIYKGLRHLGFESGNILEPSCGAGRFFEAMPQDMREKSHIVGIELDSLSSRIAAQAYPDVAVHHQGFEASRFAKGSFDVAIGNVPFGNYRVTTDPEYRGQNLLVHDYFLAKMLDEVRPGGLVVALTSKGTMDKQDTSVREMLCRRANLIGAIRLPNHAFKAAGTDTTTDLLIFQKLEKERTLEQAEGERGWIDIENPYVDGKRDYDHFINEYFRNIAPSAVLGKLAITSTAYGTDVIVKDESGQPVEKRLLEALSRLPENVYQPTDQALSVPVQEGHREAHEYGFFYEEGRIIFVGADGREDGSKTEGLSATDSKKILSAIHIREATRGLLEAQRNDCSTTELDNLMKKLNGLYDEHAVRFGRICADRSLERVFSSDPSYPLLLSLEIADTKNKRKFVEKAPIFSHRIIAPAHTPKHAETPEDALKISMQEKGRVDLSYMSALTGTSTTDLVSALEFSSIYFDPKKQEYQQSDEYLSGDVRQKMDDVKAAIEDNKRKLQAIAEHELVVDWMNFDVPSIEYEPQDATEEKIVMAAYGGAPRLEYFKEIEQKIFQKDNYKLSLLYFMARGEITLDAPMKYLEDPLFLLDALGHGVPLPHGLYYSNEKRKMRDAIAAVNILFSALSDAPSPYEYMTPTEFPDRFIYPFLRSKLLEFLPPRNLSELAGVINEQSERIQKEWEDFKAKYIQKRQDWIEASDYESVRFLKAANRSLQKNFEALDTAKPEDLKPGEIKVRLGAPWIPPYYVKEFLRDLLQTSAEDIDVEYSPTTQRWHIGGKSSDNDNPKAWMTYGVPGRMSAYDLCELALNLSFPRIYDPYYEDGKEKRKVNVELTTQAQMKQEDIKNAFEEWLWKDASRGKAVANYYNRHFNNIVPRQYSGENLIFPGMALDIELQDHQKDAIAHTLYGGNTLLAHCVGAGKSFEMAASIMEAKRLGLAHKAMVVVPKHLTEQFGAEFYRLYPGAKLLVATNKDFTKENRQAFLARAATQEWDAIVLGYSQFEKIPISHNRRVGILQSEINRLMAAIREEKEQHGVSWSIKQMESKRKALEAELKKLEDVPQDATVCFEDLGIDKLCIDEAHYFKNLYTPTKLSRVAGVQTSEAKKSWDLYEKCQYLNEKTHGKGVIFATGTPISNSMTELYTMQRYLQPDRLQEEGFSSFDSWAANFGQTVLSMELKPEGKGFQEKQRFSKFFNLPELMSLFKEIADIRTPDMLKLPVPEAEFFVEKIPASATQRAVVNELADRAEAIRARKVDREEDNMLKVTHEGRSLALDVRVYDPSLPETEDSKVNRCIKNVLDIYRETKENRSAQLIFCDQSTPTGKGPFNVYDDIKRKLMLSGVPEKEIAFVHDAKNENQKEELFGRVRRGEVRVLLGSTDMMGVGTNVQDKLIATHDLDVPWRPSDLEQRLGRIVRRGNENKKVKVFRYVTEGTFDAYMWQLIENKQRFILQIMTSSVPVREAEEVDELTLTAAEIKAIATGNPLIKEKMEVDNDLTRLKMAKSQHLSNRRQLENMIQNVYPKRIQYQQNLLEKLLADKIRMEGNTKIDGEQELFSIILNGKIYTDTKAAEAVMESALGEGLFSDGKELTGEYKGMKIRKVLDRETGKPTLVMSGNLSYRSPMAGTGKANLRLIESTYTKVIDTIEKEQKELSALEKNFASAKVEAGKPFEREQELQEKLKRSFELDAILKSEDATISGVDNTGDIMAKDVCLQQRYEENEYGITR